MAKTSLIYEDYFGKAVSVEQGKQIEKDGHSDTCAMYWNHPCDCIKARVGSTVYRIDLKQGVRASMDFYRAVNELAGSVGADRFPTRIHIALALDNNVPIERLVAGKIRYIYTMDGSVSANDAKFQAEFHAETQRCSRTNARH